jgi:glycosyltransferase involved in cell wall biosynthesis
MRILMVSEDLPAHALGGLARHVLVLARALVAAGHQVDVMGNDDVAPSACIEEFDFGGQFFGELHGQYDGWKEFFLGVFMPGKRTSLAKKFARAILKRAAPYDAIHYHGHLPNIAHHIPATINFVQTRHDQGSDCLIHTRFKRGKICQSTTPSSCAECRTWHPNLLQRKISALAVNQFRAEVASGMLRHKTLFVSDQLQANLARSFGGKRWGLTIHNFVDVGNVASRPTEPLFSKLQQRRILVAAKLYGAKGVEPFLTSLIRRPHTDLQIDIAGDGQDEARLRLAFPEVRFHGWTNRSDTLKLTREAHMVVVPSVCEEACPSTVLEALALGKTVFALRLGGTPELSQYASGPDQLRLFDSIEALVDGLLYFQPRSDFPPMRNAGTAVAQAAGRVLAVYQGAPGALGLQ